MSPSLPHTVDQDVDDDELCMVCDGKCTCASSSSQPVASTSSAPPPPIQPVPKLKIKLPPKPKIPSGLPPDLPDHFTSTQQQPPPPPKRRGRPPKNDVSASSRSRQKQSVPTRRLPPRKQTKDGIKKRQTAVKRKRVDSTDGDSSDLTDIDQFYTERHQISLPDHTGDDDRDGDAHSTQFPNFVSCTSSASSTDSDSSSLSGFETDSSIEAEEESFIIAEERARVRRELMGEETLQKRRDNNWVIRPRKRSVGTPSDIDMNGDSDASEDNGDDDEQEDDDDEDEQDESDRPGAGYVGLATGWTDDESSFDADLFFANLSSDSNSGGSSTQGDDEAIVDGYQSDLSALATSIFPHLRQSTTNMPFEVSEGWDGQIVFTNGLGEAQGPITLDVSFPASPIIIPEQSASPPSADGDGDVDMVSTTDGDPDEEGYEQDVDTVGEDDGDTTDEELVGEDYLPNERAMQLFNTPFTSVSYINPLSTMSPVSSPGPRRGSALFGLDSPKPADILAGRVYGDSDDPDDFEDETSRRASSRGGGPRQGQFEVTEPTCRAVIDDEHKDIPSPHPRFKGRHNRLSASQSIVLENLLRRTLQPIRPSSLPPSTRFPLTLPSSEVVSTSPELFPTPAVDIDDVLDSSFLDADTPIDSELQECGEGETSSTDSAFEAEGSHKHIRNLKRWDVISVGAFRKTREAVGGGRLSDSAAAGWGSDSPADYSSAMKSSPLTTMLWQNKNGQQSHAQQSQGSSSRLSYAISPDLLPVTDGDRTPTPHSRTTVKGSRGSDNHQHQKTRKEIRKERRLKQRSFTSSRHSRPRNNPHHFHQHHPNSKSRSTSSNQRNFSSPSSMPALSI